MAAQACHVDEAVISAKLARRRRQLTSPRGIFKMKNRSHLSRKVSASRAGMMAEYEEGESVGSDQTARNDRRADRCMPKTLPMIVFASRR